MTRTDPLRLRALVELNQALSTVDLRTSLPRALEVLAEAFDAGAALLALLDESGQLRIEAGFGLPRETTAGTPLRAGEGVVSQVVRSGRSVAIPRTSKEPAFTEAKLVGTRRRGAGPERSFLCAPVAVEGRAAGALGLLVPAERDREFERDMTLLEIAASMIGQAMKVERLVRAERQRLLDENRQLREELRERYDLSRTIIGNSHAIQAVFAQVAQAAPASTTVLVCGESGTGKELIAHAIHYNSPRANGPFIKVSIGALPEGLVESELFGHEPGAFTDARAQRKGRFELADGGTLFLDEVGELTPATQVKLLRVIQEREFERLGGTAPLRVDVRLVAATNRDLAAAVRAGSFREDLYYRLNVFTVFVPPLRERGSDILLLADHFVQKYATEHGKDVRRIATTAIDMLMAYHWPGNVRELQNCIERAILVCEGGAIHAHHLPPTLQTAEISGTLSQTSLEAAIRALERDLLTDALKSARGNRARAARLLQTTERVFNYKLRRLGIDPSRFH